MRNFSVPFPSVMAFAIGLSFQQAWAQHDDEFLVIEPAAGWLIIWDGNDGDHFDPEPTADGGAVVPDNLALASNGAKPFGTSELDPARWDFHIIRALNNGTYGNFSSWIGAEGDVDKFVGIDLGGQFQIGRIAWGRDNGNGAFDDSDNRGGDACDGQCDDRWGGQDPYTLQITTVASPGVDTPDGDWETVGTFTYLAMEDIEPGEGFTPWLRHEYEIARTDGNPTVATGVRIIVPAAGLSGGTAIDEIEVYGPMGDPRFFAAGVDQQSDRPDAQTLHIDIANRGPTQTLNISSATLTGDPAFTLTSFPDTLEPLARGEIVVQFDPQGRVGRYLAEIAVESNDEFFPQSTLPITIQVEHANGLIAHYKMDETEGEQLVDSSGNHFHGMYVTTGNGAVALGADPLASGKAVSFSGDLAYAEVPAEAGLPVLQTFSVSMWVEFDPASAGNFSSLVSKGTALGNPFSAIANVGGPMQFFSRGLEMETTESTMAAGQRHHFVVTHEDTNGPREGGASEVRFYLNGELVFENVEADGFDDREASPLQIGATAGQFGMVGTVDDVQIYQVEITPDDVVFLQDHPGEVIPAPRLRIRATEGYAMRWDGNDGDHFDAAPPPDGALVPENLALASNGAVPFSSSDLGPELGIDSHAAHNINDGFYGNSHSWISASGDGNPFVGVNLGGIAAITSVAWGRDNGNGAVDDSAPGTDACGGQCDDRAGGLYTLQITAVANPDADTPDDAWTTLGTLGYGENLDVEVGGGFTAFLRHEYELSRQDDRQLLATSVRLLVPAAGLGRGTAIDELEVYGTASGPAIESAEGFSIIWDGNDGANFDATPPPDGAWVPDNLALASNGAVPFASSDLGPELGIDFHVTPNINDGFYGNSNSWISASGDGNPFVGVNLGEMVNVTSVAWGRDNGNGAVDDSDPGTDGCGGQCDDRAGGRYTLQITTVLNPGADTPEDVWMTVGTFDYGENLDLEVGGAFTAFLRHEYQLSLEGDGQMFATGVRLLVPAAGLSGGTAIDELEVYGRQMGPGIGSAQGFSISWDGNEGDFYDDGAPPDGAWVPDNLALASKGAIAFTSSDYGPEIGVDFHVVANVNDGFYGNAHSWIHGSGVDQPFLGVNLGGMIDLTSVAWGRDNGNNTSDCCGGQLADRSVGVYTLQVTTVDNPGADTPNESWTTVGTIDYPSVEGDFATYLRHEYQVSHADGSPIAATGVRLLVPPTGTAVDEFEVNPVPPEEVDPGPVIEVLEGFSVAWDGNDGANFDATPPPDGAWVPDNLALASNGAVPFASSDLGPELGIDFHVTPNINDGFYGNSNSWISASGDGNPFVGVNLGGMVNVTSVAWGRDNGNGAVDDSDPGTDGCGGQCDDRAGGRYTLQITTVLNPGADTPEDVWMTVGTFDYGENLDLEVGGAFTAFLRHEYQLSLEGDGQMFATGVRLLVSAAGLSGGTAIDELEVYGRQMGPGIGSAEGFSISWDGNEGVYFDDGAPPDGAWVPDNLALASNGAIAFTSSDLGPEIGADFHVAANVNDGFYGNAHSWIHGSGVDQPFLGVNLGGMIDLTSVAWGRDNGNNTSDCCGGQLADRSVGVYTLQVTTVDNPGADTPDESWTTVGTIDYASVAGEFATYLRHEYRVSQADGSPIPATGVRLLVPPTGTAVDEFEIYAGGLEPPSGQTVSLVPDGVMIGWNGVDGARYVVEFSETLEPDSWLVLPGAENIPAAPEGDLTGIIDATATDARLRFYRVGTR